VSVREVVERHGVVSVELDDDVLVRPGSEISGIAMTWFTVCVAVVLNRLSCSRRRRRSDRRTSCSPRIVPPVVVTFQTPEPHVHRTPVEVAFASVRTLNVQLPAGMTVSFECGCPVEVDDPTTTVRGCERRGAFVPHSVVCGRNGIGNPVAVPVVIVTVVVVDVPDVVWSA
jgi:hypothetical protein